MENGTMTYAEKKGRLKPVVYRSDRNHMVINSGHRTFDRHAYGLMTGNVISDTQLSLFVRARNETACNGFTFPVGHLMETDLKSFTGPGSEVAKRFIRNVIDDDTRVILYKIRHWSPGQGEVVHGWVVTDTDYRFIRRFDCGPTRKSRQVLDAVIPYISWEKNHDEQA